MVTIVGGILIFYGCASAIVGLLYLSGRRDIDQKLKLEREKEKLEKLVREEVYKRERESDERRNILILKMVEKEVNERINASDGQI
jgi:hypothetical protein